jgi:hypothetical protein
MAEQLMVTSFRLGADTSTLSTASTAIALSVFTSVTELPAGVSVSAEEMI